MVNLQRLQIKRCYTCGLGVQMLDGNAWCSVTNKPESGIACNYSPGFSKLYKPEPKAIKKEKLVVKTTPVSKIKPISTEQKSIISKKKTTSPQQKLF